MKLSFMLLIVCVLQASASSYAQKITITVKEASIQDVFKKIAKQSDYNFLYDSDLLDKANPVNITVENASLEDVLKVLFNDQPLKYTIKKNTIIVKPKPIPVNEPPLVIKDVIVSGKVVDAKGQPLPGATIKVKGGTTSAVTSSGGSYSIKLTTGNETLVFSYIGFVSQEVIASGKKTIDIVLQEQHTALNEIVIIGYGTQKKVDLTGAVSSISGSDLSVKPVGQTSAALQGLAPGVTIKQQSGRPGGDGGSIRIRGVGTLNNSNPLTLIDGVEGSIDNIDPNLIESVSILKDAASSAVYGSRAANGVLLITTKRAGKKMTIQYNNYFGWQKTANLPDEANALDYMLLLNLAYTNAGRTAPYSDELIQAYQEQNGVSSDQYPNTDWQKETLTGSGLEHSNFVTLNAGSDKIRTATSLGYFDQTGIIQTSRFKRYTLRNNLDVTFSDKLSLKFDIQVVDAITTEPGVGSGRIFNYMNGIPANQIGINSNGSWGVGWTGSNPIAAASSDGGRNIATSPYGILNATMIYHPFKWLTADLTAAPKYAESYGDNFTRSIQTYLPDGTPSYVVPSLTTLTNSSSRSLYNTFRATLTAIKNFGPHNFKLLFGASDEDYSNKSFSAYRDTYVLTDFPIINAGSAANQQTSGTAEAWALRSYFGRLNYDYKEKYLFEFNGRYDGSSRFTENHRYAFFPSASAGWRVSEEGFMRPFEKVIDELKIRASWGRLGNQNIGTYPSTTAVAIGTSDIGKQIVGVAALNALANKDIIWETSEMSDVGLDLTLFSHLNITADYYYKKTTDILLQLDIPLITGLSAPFQNAGVVTNRGWELAIGYKGNVNAFKYGVNFNLSDVINKVIDLRGINETTTTATREGYPIKSLYGYQAEGIFQTDDQVENHATQFGTVAPGDIMYKDQNDDGVINSNDKVILGNIIPRYTFGATFNGSFKGFDFNVFLQGVGKTDGYLSGPGFQPFSVTSIGGTVLEQFKDNWTLQNTDAQFPRLVFGGTNNAQVSSFWVKSAAYLRVKNIQLGYTLPAGLTRKAALKSLRLFVNGANLFTIDRFWKGFDVESPIGDITNYPQQKLYTFGLNANF